MTTASRAQLVTVLPISVAEDDEEDAYESGTSLSSSPVSQPIPTPHRLRHAISLLPGKMVVASQRIRMFRHEVLTRVSLGLSRSPSLVLLRYAASWLQRAVRVDSYCRCWVATMCSALRPQHRRPPRPATVHVTIIETFATGDGTDGAAFHLLEAESGSEDEGHGHATRHVYVRSVCSAPLLCVCVCGCDLTPHRRRRLNDLSEA